MTPNARKDAPETPETPAKWLPVAAAAARLGISTKTLRRRMADGEIESRRVPQKRGGIAYQVALEVDTEVDTKGKRDGSEMDTETELPREKRPEVDTETEAKWTRKGSEVEVALLRESLAREREVSNAFREQLLDANRNAAELRSALRKALDVAPRQLTGASSTKTGPESLRSSSSNDLGVGNANGQQSAPELREAATDELSGAELDALIWRVCGK
jgi:hypothetical protein